MNEVIERQKNMKYSWMRKPS